MKTEQKDLQRQIMHMQIKRCYGQSLNYLQTGQTRKSFQTGKESMRENIILLDSSINNTSLTEDINYMSTRRSNISFRFNSTMKNQNHFNSYSPYGNHSKYSNKQGYSPKNNHYNYNNNKNFKGFNIRRLNRYKDQSRWPKKDIKSEYNTGDKNMMENLRRTINYMKVGNQNREEDVIATISISKIQNILNEDPDLTTVPDDQDVCQIDVVEGSLKSTTLSAIISNKDITFIFDKGATTSVMSG